MGIHLKWLLVCIICLMLVGCSATKNSDYVSIDGDKVSDSEVMLYLAKTYDDFLQLGGDDVWQIEDFSNGRSADEVAKQGAIDNLIKVKILKTIADDSDMTIDSDEEAVIKEQAALYYKALSKDFISKHNIQLEEVQMVFLENYLADQVESFTMSNYSVEDQEVETYMLRNPEYEQLVGKNTSDLLTTYLVHHIVVYTHEKDESGEWQAKDNDGMALALEKFDEAYAAILGGEDFFEVTKSYSENKYFEAEKDGLRLSKAQLPDALREAIDPLEVGEFCEPVIGDYGYHTFLLLEKKIPTSGEIEEYDEKFLVWETALRDEAKLTLIKDVFNDIYKKWRDAKNIEFSQGWIELDFLETIHNYK